MMLPEHETHLTDHISKMGQFFIIDGLKRKFPKLTHDEACAIYREFMAKHAEDEPVKQSTAQIKKVGQELADEIHKHLKKTFD